VPPPPTFALELTAKCRGCRKPREPEHLNGVEKLSDGKTMLVLLDVPCACGERHALVSVRIG
jgi:hypothetical protein